MQKVVPIHPFPITWVLVADNRQAKVYRRTETERYIPKPGASRNRVERVMTGELVPVPGMEFHAEAPGDFAREVAGHICNAWRHRAFKRIILVAPAKMLSALRKYCPAMMHDCIVAEVPKELTHCDGAEIAEHLNHVA